MFFFLATGLMTLVPGAVFADVTQDCIKSCSDQKASDDKNCQPSGQGADQGGAECLKNNQDIFNDCMKNWSPGSPPAATSAQPAAPRGSATQGAVPQVVNPQGATPQSTAPQGVTSPTTNQPGKQQ